MTNTVQVSGTLVRVVFTPLDGTGTVYIPGLKVGDTMVSLYRLSNGDNEIGNITDFKGVVLTDGELQQVASSLGPTESVAFFARPNS